MNEVNELLAFMADMFPETPLGYLMIQCQDLVGKPAAIERFINQLTADPQPPDNWSANQSLLTESEVEEDDSIQILEQTDDEIVEEGRASPSQNPPREPPKTEEEKANERQATLVTLFPTVDPDFLRQKGVEFGFDTDSEENLNRWIDTHIEKGYKDLPTREDYEKRVKEAEIIKKFQSVGTVQEILDMKDDPEANFTVKTRKAHQGMCSKRKRELESYQRKAKKLRQELVLEAGKAGILMECLCCYSDDCLEEEMLPCPAGHLYCLECIQRASDVAIGDGKTKLCCLTQCDQEFALSTLQKALKPNIYSKWIKRIQIGELETARIDGLEQCPFCPFAAIMYSTPEENKIFTCQNPDCGKDSCRLCHEPSHIPLKCEEVENDSEVKKRTYIENKMTEALIRQCWSCKKPIVKQGGCNHMTCVCGASMCYICKQPWNAHDNRKCRGAGTEQELHRRDVTQAAEEAKRKTEEENPEVKLKHDPTAQMKTQKQKDKKKNTRRKR